MTNQWDPLTDMPSLQGKVVFLTGGCTGIGYATIKALVRRGAKVYFTARAESKAQKAKETLLSQAPDVDPENIQWLVMDLCDLKSIDAAALELGKRESKVDILINNAAVSTAVTELVDGIWEQHMAGNFLGPFMFVNRIIPLLKNATKQENADVRIVNLTSIAHISMLPRNFDFRFNSAICFKQPIASYPAIWRFLGKFVFGFDLMRYAVSRNATVIFTQELQRRFNEQGLPILCTCVHPGEVLTEGVLEVNGLFIQTVARLLFAPVDQGAVAPLFAATAEEVRRDAKTYGGKFLMPVGKVTKPNPVADDEGQVKGLWNVATTELNKQLAVKKLPALQAWRLMYSG
ncbi:hypothetical protein BKA61DRAFT_571546 [Leptodontidium sp. MPI-SDFR-AT-0119]|nr:hypothetical protein BKA61DRAFT_571546 [Leptodontidium sp. MPI-SDFR-AT-0119]